MCVCVCVCVYWAEYTNQDLCVAFTKKCLIPLAFCIFGVPQAPSVRGRLVDVLLNFKVYFSIILRFRWCKNVHRMQQNIIKSVVYKKWAIHFNPVLWIWLWMEQWLALHTISWLHFCRTERLYGLLIHLLHVIKHFFIQTFSSVSFQFITTDCSIVTVKAVATKIRNYYFENKFDGGKIA